MDDAARMSRVQPVGDLDGPVEQGFEQQGLVANAMLQRGALQEFHRQERMPVVLADLVEGTDVRMIDGCRGARFLPEAFDRYAVASHFLREKFQGDFPAEFQVLGAIDDAHATAAKFLDNPVVRDVLAGCHRSPRSTLPQIVSLCRNIYDGWSSAHIASICATAPKQGAGKRRIEFRMDCRASGSGAVALLHRSTCCAIPRARSGLRGGASAYLRRFCHHAFASVADRISTPPAIELAAGRSPCTSHTQTGFSAGSRSRTVVASKAGT